MLTRTLLLFLLLTTPPAFAEPVAATAKTPVFKPAAIIYFNNGSSMEEEHASLIKNMIKEASTNLGIAIHDYPLTSENELSSQIEKIADTDIGLIVIVEPHNTDALIKLPSLYPDIHFTIIGASTSIYLANVRSIAFKEPEGVFMMGVLAALHSKTGTVSFISKDNNETSRNLAYAFLQGTKYANPDVQIVEQLGSKTTHRIPNADNNLPSKETNSDIVFALDDELLDGTLKMAKNKKQLVISYNHSLVETYPGLVLTSLVNHYDIAVYNTLRNYTHNQWRPGSESMGIGNSYIDYVLDTQNRALMPKEMIDQIEMVKDFVSQGIIQVNNLVQ